MRALRLFGRRAIAFGVGVAKPTAVRTPCRCLSQREIVAADLRADDTFSDGAALSATTSPFADDTFTGEFDELEAASQEIHDLCFAMISHLQKVDPDETKDLFQKRGARRFREPVTENKRRLLHGHGLKSLHRRNCYRTRQEYEEATQLFLQFGEKLLLLLTKPVMDRIIETSGKGYRDHRSDGVHKYRKPLERASWRGFPHRWYKHAPFEVQQLRADMPEAAVNNTRTMRDLSTIRSLFTLMEPQHSFRSAIENRLFEITREYDAVHKSTKGGDLASLPLYTS
ncbi:hypothetical protein TraAM80_02301 [Trypanosoma rangeli]|uniref:Uncharacterized protein n=1 Tax=Trypanosoma rangeli TaxID=5698 RepID=A0A3R7KKG3_TRYRA|nr:uncharacterized protein TraAM80_02301 [Trypanosoma rangeli]RNF09258.1 hypothetical protein TraAM80_02301 [Trypanosoma rangeli]|eukprot:RNF09258.1 hypothetical protein TraAM80_02301 [Trypanosoma rangeli]